MTIHELGTLSESEKKLEAKITAADLFTCLAHRDRLHLEVGIPRRKGYAFVIKELDEWQPYRAGVWDQGEQECAERQFDDLFSAVSWVLSNVVFA